MLPKHELSVEQSLTISVLPAKFKETIGYRAPKTIKINEKSCYGRYIQNPWIDKRRNSQRLQTSQHKPPSQSFRQERGVDGKSKVRHFWRRQGNSSTGNGQTI